MIYAVDIADMQPSLGWQMIMHAVRQMPLPLEYVPKSAVKKYDYSQALVLLFSFHHFRDYLAFPSLLRKMKIPVWAKDRPGFPILIAGGPDISVNPEPVTEFLDVICIGNGELWIKEVLTLIFNKGFDDKKAILSAIYGDIAGSYVPSLYKIAYNPDESIKSLAGERVAANKGDINYCVKNDIQATRIRKRQTLFSNGNKEYLLELHRGCTRECAFCAYSWLNRPYREVDPQLLLEKMNKLTIYDHDKLNKIILTQTSGTNYPEEILSYAQISGRLPHYTSNILHDLYQEPEKVEIWKQNKTFFRLGVEGFSETERRRWGKYISNQELIEMPSLLQTDEIKLFFISHLPGQTVADCREFVEHVFPLMAQSTKQAFRLVCHVTACVFNLSCPISFFPKKFKREVWQYLRQHRKIQIGKAQVHFLKNSGLFYFWKDNILSLGNRKLAAVLAKVPMTIKPKQFCQAVKDSGLNLKALFGEYDPAKVYATDFIELYPGHRADIRQRYEKIRSKM